MSSRSHPPTLLLFLVMLFAIFGERAIAQSREEKVRADRKRVMEEGFWIYNDLGRAFQEAKENGKPILVILRCLPCEECVKLDDDLVDQDPVIRPLLEQYVCARQVSTNGLDLELFQYDTDQSFAAFLLNADGTIYGRFGTRSHRTQWLGDVSLHGLAEALQGGLDLHANYPSNKKSLAGKRGGKPEFATPELFPRLKGKYTDTLNYQGDVVKSCIHCHQIGEARREFYWQRGERIPEKILFPYPHPKSLGMILDPQQKATVQSIKPNSIAEDSGLQSGDVLVSFGGQPPLSIADIQWVLHQTDPEGGSVSMKVERGDQSVALSLDLPPKWRRAGDLSWRVTSWGYRRITLGGLVLKTLDREERLQQSISEEKMALRVTHVGQYGDHAAAKRAGFKKHDVLVRYDGQDDFRTETELFHYALNHRKIGDKVPVIVRRDGHRVSLALPIQK